jgi:4-amino-4-deoxy-L-arabinose transferase-like glycosyltransferase
MALLPYLLILFLSTYGIGKFLYSRFVGLLAVFFLFFYPIIFQSLRQYQLDLPLTAGVTLCIYLLLKADQFRNTKYCFLLGLTCGFVMLVKGQALLFIAGPFIYLLYRSFIISDNATPLNFFKLRQLRNLFIVLIISSVIAWVWWGANIEPAMSEFKSHIFDIDKNFERTPYIWADKYSVGCVFFHVRSLFYSSLRPFFASLFLVLLVPCLRKKIKYGGLYLSWIIPPLLLFSLAFTIKHSRFLMPILPALALITALGLESLKNKKVKFLIVLISVIFAFFQFYILSFSEHKYRAVSIGAFKIFGQDGFGANYEIRWPPHNEELKIDEVAKIIINNKTPGRVSSVLLIDTGEEGPGYFEMFFYLKMQDGSLLFNNLLTLFESGKRLDSVDFIVWYTSLQDSVHWFEVGKYIKTYRSVYFDEMQDFEAEFQNRKRQPAWKDFLKSLEEARSNFLLIGEVKERKNKFYIYKQDLD